MMITQIDAELNLWEDDEGNIWVLETKENLVFLQNRQFTLTENPLSEILDRRVA